MIVAKHSKACEGWICHSETNKDSLALSCSRARRMKDAKRKGRHSGYGKRKGTREARLPTKVKGNVFKNKCVFDGEHSQVKGEKAREKTLSDQFEAKRAKNKASRERKHARREERLAQGHVDRAPTTAPVSTPTPAPQSAPPKKAKK
ncbi:hypothetical protein IFM89_001243 [Coptis chinensis]|uniref:Large ribosomal subunit protein eL19 domain-containing protein n=1 Tax=Coptis chinensis TaxID=261450 RepID=A0A835H3R7_9MAGN|nr:hypothetical protein IFM89_001243 [Coptis chinensis]